MRIEPYVLITDIPAAHYRCVIIHRERFVVHAVVELLKLGRETPAASQQVAIATAVKSPQRDIGMGDH